MLTSAMDEWKLLGKDISVYSDGQSTNLSKKDLAKMLLAILDNETDAGFEFSDPAILARLLRDIH